MTRSLIPATLAISALAISAGAAGRKPARPAAPETTALEDARRNARAMADFYRESLLVMHATYVTDGKKAPSATVLKKLFPAMAAKGWPRARWLSVNGNPLNRDNVPKDAFETGAGRALRRGEKWVEEVSGSRYRAVAAVDFTGPCLTCHWGDRPNEYVGAISFTMPLPPAAKGAR